MESKNTNNSPSLTKIHLDSIYPIFYLPFDQIISLYKQNKSFNQQFKDIYIQVEKEYSQYYNLNTRKKLNSIIPLLESSLPTYMSKFNNLPKLPKAEQLKALCYNLVYSKIMNKIISLNKIILFKYTIDDNTKYNFNQLISLIMFMTYPKEIIININNISLISNSQFQVLVSEIIKKKNIVSMTIYFNNNNYFTISRNSKKLFTAIKESNVLYNKTFLTYRDLAFYIFNKEIKIENISYNFEDFFDDNLSNEQKIDLSYINNIELSLCFKDDKKNQLNNCLTFLNDSFKNSKINTASKDKLLSLKMQLFTLPNDFDYKNIANLVSNLKPNNIWLIPYKDIDNKYANDFLYKINSACDVHIFNIINFVGFDQKCLGEFIQKQKNLVDLRICGKMGEDEMELILKKYMDILENDKNFEYKIKRISLNGPINMNQKWVELICKFLKLKQIEAFHLDCFF